MNDEPNIKQPPRRRKKAGSAAKKPKKRQQSPLKRRELLVLVGVWLAGCALVGLLVATFYRYSSPVEAGAPTPPAAQTVEIVFGDGQAKTVYLAGLADAREWQPDVQLVSMTADWQNATPDSLGQIDSWGYTFYSLTNQRIYLGGITLNEAPVGRAHLVKLRRQPKLIEPARWVVDSNEAIAIWLGNGGSAFLQAYPENQVEMLLRQSAELNKPIWNIIATSADQSQLFFLTIDATEGAVLNRT